MNDSADLRRHPPSATRSGSGLGTRGPTVSTGGAPGRESAESRIRLLDLSFREPEMNLACDEFLLDRAESGRGGQVLRIWESAVPFVVLGVSQPVRDYVRDNLCKQDGIPILRRCSAGGCVLQGPGCLNFALVLSHKLHPDVATIRGSYCYILGKLAATLRARGVAACHKGVSDLAVGGKKISGNAQRRRKRFILHHGTILYGMDAGLMERYLVEPNDRPKYRGDRPHRKFVRSVPLNPEIIREAICEAFGVVAPGIRLRKAERSDIEELAHEKYLSHMWNYRR